MNLLFIKRRQILAQLVLRIQLGAVLGATLCVRAEPLVFRPKSHRAMIGSSFYSSQDNFDPLDGSFEKLGDNKSYKLNIYNFEWDYVATNRQAWKLGLHFHQGESSDGINQRKNADLANGYLGFQYYLRAKPLKVKPEIIVFYPKATVDPNADDAIISENVMEIQLGVWLQKKFFTLDNYGYLGGRYRAGGRSSLAEYLLGTKKDFGGLIVGGEFFGFQSVTDDEFTPTPSLRKEVTTRVNGGSLKFYSVNPQLLSASGFFLLQMSEALSLRASYGVDLQGKNMAKGTTIGVQIGWDFSAGPEEFTKTRRQQESNDALGKFNIESTEYDEDLFREERPKPLLRKKQKSVQQMLDEAEKYLDKK